MVRVTAIACAFLAVVIAFVLVLVLIFLRCYQPRLSLSHLRLPCDCRHHDVCHLYNRGVCVFDLRIDLIYQKLSNLPILFVRLHILARVFFWGGRGGFSFHSLRFCLGITTYQ